MKAGPEWLKAPNSTTAGIDAHCGTDNSLKRKSLFDLAALVRSVASGLLPHLVYNYSCITRSWQKGAGS